MRYKKIMILTIILTFLLAVSTASAENNAADDIISVDVSEDVVGVQDATDDIISITVEDVVSVEYNNETVVASEDQSYGVLNVENQDVSDVNVTESNLLTVENNNVSIATCDDDVLTVENNNEPLTFGTPFTSTVQGFTNYKTFIMGKIKFPIKYLKFANYKPSKKNKKLWKQYIIYKKYERKASIILYKQVKKVILKAIKNHWHSYGNAYFRYHKVGKYIVYTYYQKAYRRYNYNGITNEEWWD